MDPIIRIDPRYEVRQHCPNCRRLQEELQKAREMIEALTRNSTVSEPILDSRIADQMWSWMREDRALL
jgi:hypothetical protein